MPSGVGVVSAVGAAVDIVVGACKGQTANSPAYLRKDTTYDAKTNHEINHKTCPCNTRYIHCTRGKQTSTWPGGMREAIRQPTFGGACGVLDVSKSFKLLFF